MLRGIQRSPRSSGKNGSFFRRSIISFGRVVKCDDNSTSRLQLPDLHHAILTGAGDIIAIWCPGNLEDNIAMAAIEQESLPGYSVPHVHDIVITARNALLKVILLAIMMPNFRHCRGK